MTVAIAAICKMQGGTAVIAAEDHMITAGDIEFEQPQPKMWRQGPQALALMYGDATAQAEIAAGCEKQVIQGQTTDLSEIADKYHSQMRSHVRRLAEADILDPLNLSIQSFSSQQSALGPVISVELITQLQGYYVRSGLYRSFGGAILIGADQTGGKGHIYKIEYGERALVDRIGFVAAGVGQWHAESQFMFSRYTTEWDLPEALSLLYTAKKRAEVAPGVGTETDIVIVTTNPPSINHFNMVSPLVLRLEEIYQAGKQRHEDATAWQHQEVRSYIEPLLTQNPTPPSPTGGTAGTAPAPVAPPAPATPPAAEAPEPSTR